MNTNFDKALGWVLADEGGFSNNPADPGGMTNMGVTARSWSEWTGADVTEAEMRALTPEEVGPMYRSFYWDFVDGDDMPAGVDYCLFDWAVNSGPSTAVRMLQTILGVTADGIMGPVTLAAARSMPEGALVAGLCEARLNYLKQLTGWADFGAGWGARVARVLSRAAGLIL